MFMDGVDSPRAGGKHLARSPSSLDQANNSNQWTSLRLDRDDHDDRDDRDDRDARDARASSPVRTQAIHARTLDFAPTPAALVRKGAAPSRIRSAARGEARSRPGVMILGLLRESPSVRCTTTLECSRWLRVEHNAGLLSKMSQDMSTCDKKCDKIFL